MNTSFIAPVARKPLLMMNKEELMQVIAREKKKKLIIKNHIEHGGTMESLYAQYGTRFERL